VRQLTFGIAVAARRTMRQKRIGRSVGIELVGGAGEEPISALFPTLAKAFFDATGLRIRRVPMKPAVVRDTLARAAAR
jgi:CO/xanthine dehydrogenase Mo-binding subunit